MIDLDEDDDEDFTPEDYVDIETYHARRVFFRYERNEYAANIQVLGGDTTRGCTYCKSRTNARRIGVSVDDVAAELTGTVPAGELYDALVSKLNKAGLQGRVVCPLHIEEFRQDLEASLERLQSEN